MLRIPEAHDHFIRAAFAHEGVPEDFITHYLPQEFVAQLDLTSLEQVEGSFVDTALQIHISDLLFRVGLRDRRSVYVYLLFEHKSYPDPLTAYQVLRYMMRIWEQQDPPPLPRYERRLPAILPLVLYHGEERWRGPLNFADLVEEVTGLEGNVPDFEYQLCDLSIYDDRELSGSEKVRGTMILLKHAFETAWQGRPYTAQIIKLIYTLWARKELEFVELMVRYMASWSHGMTLEDFNMIVAEALPGEGDEFMNSVASHWFEEGREAGIKEGIKEGILQGLKEGRQEGREEGRQEGREEGREEGLRIGRVQSAREHVLSLLEVRFGKVPPLMAQLLGHISDPDRLDYLFRQAAQVESLEDFEDVLTAEQ